MKDRYYSANKCLVLVLFPLSYFNSGVVFCFLPSFVFFLLFSCSTYADELKIGDELPNLLPVATLQCLPSLLLIFTALTKQ